jgi:hypothetical protein
MRALGVVRTVGMAALLSLFAASGCGGIVGLKTCHEVTAASGSSPQTCAQEDSDATTCPSGSSSGKCPTSGLVGCCKTSVNTGVGTAYAAACYYDSTTAATAQTNCTGTYESWVTSAP